MSALPVDPKRAQPIPSEGATLHLRIGGTRRRLDATVSRWNGRMGVVDVEERLPAGVAIAVRLVEPSGLAWTAQAVAGSADVLRRQVALRITTPWQPAESRGSQRVVATGLDLTCRLEGRELELRPIDVSPTGCRARGLGEHPHVNDHVVLVPRVEGDARRPMPARVVRIEPGDDGTYDVAFQFLLETAAERASAAWLVGAARRTAG